jgi:hypothetical protein
LPLQFGGALSRLNAAGAERNIRVGLVGIHAACIICTAGQQDAKQLRLSLMLHCVGVCICRRVCFAGAKVGSMASASRS